MATSQVTSSGPESFLQVRRTFGAPRERVFAAWTQRDQLNQWMGRSGHQSTAEYLELDLRPGGSYRIRVVAAEGHVYSVYGVYREIRPPEKLSFTWEWEKSSPTGEPIEKLSETLVTVEFFERGRQTEVVLTHTGFSSVSHRDRHQLGWTGCFDALERILSDLQSLALADTSTPNRLTGKE